eukprot:g7845.t1
MPDVSFGEIVVITGVGALLLGRRDLPKLARTAGSAFGRFVGGAIRTRRQLEGLSNTNELVKMHTEFRQGVAEIEQIRHDLQSVTSLQRRPVPLGVPTQAASPAAGAGGALETAAGLGKASEPALPRPNVLAADRGAAALGSSSSLGAIEGGVVAPAASSSGGSSG